MDTITAGAGRIVGMLDVLPSRNRAHSTVRVITSARVDVEVPRALVPRIAEQVLARAGHLESFSLRQLASRKLRLRRSQRQAGANNYRQDSHHGILIMAYSSR